MKTQFKWYGLWLRDLRKIVVTVLCLLANVTILPGSTRAQIACTVSQITDTFVVINTRSSINADGTRIAFESTSDLTGNNADGNREIFLFDTTTSTFTQVTNTTEAVSFGPSVNADGTRIAFHSSSDVTGNNADGNREIFLFDTTTSTFTQVTSTTEGGSFAPSINADGTRIAFISNSDLTGNNADGNVEIFLFDTTTSTFTQVTSTTEGESDAPSINADETRIAFESTSDLTKNNADGNSEIFLFDTTTSTFTQVTSSTEGESLIASINADGTRIAFHSSSDVTGNNADGNREIFLFDTTTSTFTQVTSSTEGESLIASINADGTLIAFHSSSDLTGNNADGNFEIFLFDTTTSTFTQVTSTTEGFSFSSSINVDGTRIAIESTSDLTGNNADANREIFLGVCGVDTDGDAIPDSLDNCPDDSNPNQLDRDGDGQGDECDVCPILRLFGEDSEEVQLLRDFRDNVLNQTPEGQQLIKLYYAWSPVIVRALEEDENFRQEITELIDGILPLVERVIE